MRKAEQPRQHETWETPQPFRVLISLLRYGISKTQALESATDHTKKDATAGSFSVPAERPSAWTQASGRMERMQWQRLLKSPLRSTEALGCSRRGH